MHATVATLSLCALLAGSTARAQAPATPGGLPPATPPATSPPPSMSVSPPKNMPVPRAEPAPSKAPLPRGAVLEEVSGLVQDLDRKAYKLTIGSASGPVTLALDRNTMVYTANGLGTVLDIAPGQQIRAGRNADFLAYWVQLRVPPKAEPVPTPAQGTGPAGSGAAPATEGTGQGPTAPPTPPTTPGSVPPGPAPAGTPPAGTPPAGQ
jgi:hypothetical protein